jgi:hypothetical protein
MNPNLISVEFGELGEIIADIHRKLENQEEAIKEPPWMAVVEERFSKIESQFHEFKVENVRTAAEVSENHREMEKIRKHSVIAMQQREPLLAFASKARERGKSKEAMAIRIQAVVRKWLTKIHVHHLRRQPSTRPHHPMRRQPSSRHNHSHSRPRGLTLDDASIDSQYSYAPFSPKMNDESSQQIKVLKIDVESIDDRMKITMLSTEKKFENVLSSLTSLKAKLNEGYRATTNLGGDMLELRKDLQNQITHQDESLMQKYNIALSEAVRELHVVIARLEKSQQLAEELMHKEIEKNCLQIDEIHTQVEMISAYTDTIEDMRDEIATLSNDVLIEKQRGDTLEEENMAKGKQINALHLFFVALCKKLGLPFSEIATKEQLGLFHAFDENAGEEPGILKVIKSDLLELGANQTMNSDAIDAQEEKLDEIQDTLGNVTNSELASIREHNTKLGTMEGTLLSIGEEIVENRQAAESLKSELQQVEAAGSSSDQNLKEVEDRLKRHDEKHSNMSINHAKAQSDLKDLRRAQTTAETRVDDLEKNMGESFAHNETALKDIHEDVGRFEIFREATEGHLKVLDTTLKETTSSLARTIQTVGSNDNKAHQSVSDLKQNVETAVKATNSKVAQLNSRLDVSHASLRKTIDENAKISREEHQASNEFARNLEADHVASVKVIRQAQGQISTLTGSDNVEGMMQLLDEHAYTLGGICARYETGVAEEGKTLTGDLQRDIADIVQQVVHIVAKLGDFEGIREFLSSSIASPYEINMPHPENIRSAVSAQFAGNLLEKLEDLAAVPSSKIYAEARTNFLKRVKSALEVGLSRYSTIQPATTVFGRQRIQPTCVACDRPLVGQQNGESFAPSEDYPISTNPRAKISNTKQSEWGDQRSKAAPSNIIRVETTRINGGPKKANTRQIAFPGGGSPYIYKAGFKMAKSTSATQLQQELAAQRRSKIDHVLNHSTSHSKVLQSVARTRPRTAPSTKAKPVVAMPPIIDPEDSHMAGRIRPGDIENTPNRNE